MNLNGQDIITVVRTAKHATVVNILGSITGVIAPNRMSSDAICSVLGSVIDIELVASEPIRVSSEMICDVSVLSIILICHNSIFTKHKVKNFFQSLGLILGHTLKVCSDYH